jgi:hypothetical protein
MKGGLKRAGWRLGIWALALTAVEIVGLKVSCLEAQPLPGEGPPPARFPMTPEERRERLRMVRMWRLIDVLNLREGQSEKFFLTLKRYDAEEDRVNRERERLSAALRGMVVRPETPEKALLDTMQAIREQDERLRQARARFHAEVAGALSVRQQAKLLLFEQRFDSVLREAIFDVMVRRRPGGGWGEGWGPPPGRQGPAAEPPR